MTHTFDKESKQNLSIKGHIHEEDISQIAKTHLQGLQEIGISSPQWQEGPYGVVLLLITYCIFETENNVR